MGHPDLKPGEATWKDTLQRYAPAMEDRDWVDMEKRLKDAPPAGSMTFFPLLLGVGLGMLIMLLYLLSFRSSEKVIATPELEAVPPSISHTSELPAIAESNEEEVYIPTRATHRVPTSPDHANLDKPSVPELSQVLSNPIPAPKTLIANFNELSEEEYTPGLMSVSRLKTKIRPVKYDGWILPHPPVGEISKEK